MSQRKLRDLPHPLALPKLLGSTGNRKPPGVSHKLKGVKRSPEAVEQETAGPSASPVLQWVGREALQEGGQHFFPGLSALGHSLPSATVLVLLLIACSCCCVHCCCSERRDGKTPVRPRKPR